MLLRFWPSTWWLAFAMLLVVACQPEASGSADLLVAVRTDYLAGDEFARIEVKVSGAKAPVTSEACAGESCTSFSQARIVASFEALPVSSGRRVDVTLLDAAGAVVASDSGVLQHDRRTAMVLWVTRTCENVSCEDGDRCLGGQCVDVRCTDGSQAECGAAGTRCERAADCPTLACGTASCERGVCSLVPDSSACETGTACVPEVGCVGESDGDGDEGDGQDGDGQPSNDDGGVTTPEGPKNRFPDLVPATTSYTSQTGVNYVASAWIGNEVAILTLDASYDPEVMGRILTVYDDVYAYYKRFTGRAPTRFQSIAGRAVIAFLDETCMQGFCVRSGQTGLEMLASEFDILYDGVAASDRFDVSVLEKVALMFWFYEAQVGFVNHNAMSFGFAMCLALDGLQSVSPSVMQRGPRDLADYRAVLEQFVDTYVELGAPFDTTVAVGTAPSNQNQLGSGALVCSMLRRLGARHGGAKYDASLWQQVGSLPATTTDLEVAEGFLVAASRAARANLTSVIVDRWGFPTTADARALAEAAGAPVDPSAY